MLILNRQKILEQIGAVAVPQFTLGLIVSSAMADTTGNLLRLQKQLLSIHFENQERAVNSVPEYQLIDEPFVLSFYIINGCCK